MNNNNNNNNSNNNNNNNNNNPTKTVCLLFCDDLCVIFLMLDFAKSIHKGIQNIYF